MTASQAPAGAFPDLRMRAPGLQERLRAGRVRVHAVTNAAEQVFTANLLLATGGIPSLTVAPEEVASFKVETGLPKCAPFYSAPGFNKPNAASEFLASSTAREELALDLQAAVREACRAEHTLGLADAHQQNAAALTEILARYPVTSAASPRPILEATRKASTELTAEIAATSPLTRRIVESYAKAVSDMRGWTILAAYGSRDGAAVATSFG